jgi:tRNA threonylcarbamoyladenosine biosynthesis protein TsaE
MPILDANSLEFFSRSPDQTRRIGMRLGTMLQPGDIICLKGDLGAGKTTLVQGLARGWGSLDPVSSPTFIIVNVYRRPDGQTLSHLDAYRLENWTEAEDLDLLPLMESGPVVVEWPERIIEVLPQEHLSIAMRWLADDERGMILTASGKRYLKILAGIRKQVYGGL